LWRWWEAWSSKSSQSCRRARWAGEANRLPAPFLVKEGELRRWEGSFQRGAACAVPSGCTGRPLCLCSRQRVGERERMEVSRAALRFPFSWSWPAGWGRILCGIDVGFATMEGHC
jgi:hypothetical protein